MQSEATRPENEKAVEERKIFIVDDHPLLRKGYVALLEGEPDLSVGGEAETAAEALRKIRETLPDLMVVDISLPGMSGLELIKHLHAEYPTLPVLAISTYDESVYAERVLVAGARGYVMKAEADDTVLTAIRRLLDGDFYLSDAMSTRILSRYQQHAQSWEQDQAGDVNAVAPVQHLSDRELEVFELMGRGYTSQRIAEALSISPKTVESHRGRIKRKLGLDSTSQLMRQATLWVAQQA